MSDHPLKLDEPGKLFISESTSAAVNLAFENFLFQQASLPCLLLYRNTPSIIIGRNQNPWVEANLKHLQSHNIGLFRRFSGGGTVYHDLGNTNYSYMMPRAAFDRDTTAQKLINGLQSIGLDVALNARHDITIQTHDGWRKCSGSAYKIAKDRAYAHGTMLLRADLNNLGPALRAGEWGIKGHGVESVRSKVANLDLSHEQFCATVSDAFGMLPQHVYEEEMMQIESVRMSVEQLQSHAWKFQQTPAFTQSVVAAGGTVVATVKSGKYFSFQAERGIDLQDLVGQDFVVDKMSQFLQQVK